MGRKVEVDMAIYLEAGIPWITRQSTASQKGITPTLFIGDLPAPKAAVTGNPGVPVESMSLSEYTGESPERVLGGSRKRIEKPRILVTVRAARYDKAQDLSYGIHDYLDGKAGVVINGTNHVWIQAVGLPSEGTPDGSNNAIFNTNFMIWREFDA